MSQECGTLTGFLVKADTSSHTKWQKRWFAKIEVSSIRELTWKLTTAKRTLHAQASSVSELSQWMAAIEAAIKAERDLAEGAFGIDSDDRSDGEEISSSVCQTKLVGNYSDIVRASTRLPQCAKGFEDTNRVRVTKDQLVRNDRDDASRRPLWEPMVGLFHQLMNHLGTPSPQKATGRGARTSTTYSSSKSISCPSSATSWRLGSPLSERFTVPPLILNCCNFLRSKNRLDTVGIFRVPGQATVVDVIREELSKSSLRIDDTKGFEYLIYSCTSPNARKKDTIVALSGDDDVERRAVHNVAALMKRCLVDDLPNAVVPKQCYAHLLRAQRESTTSEARLAALRTILLDRSLMPVYHLECLRYLLEFFGDVCAHKDVNKMRPSNIAVCFAPTILRPPQPAPGTSPAAVMGEVCTGIETVKTLIVHGNGDFFNKSDADKNEDSSSSVSRDARNPKTDPQKISKKSVSSKGVECVGASRVSTAKATLRRASVVRTSVARQEKSMDRGLRTRSVTIGDARRRKGAGRMRSDALLAIGSDDEETRRRTEEESSFSMSDRTLFVTDASIRFSNSCAKWCRLLLDASATKLHLLTLAGDVSVSSIVDVHRHHGNGEECFDSVSGTKRTVAKSRTKSWHTLSLSLSPRVSSTKIAESDVRSRILHFSAPPADAERWSKAIGAVATHSQYCIRRRDMEASCTPAGSTIPLRNVDVNVLLHEGRRNKRNVVMDESKKTDMSTTCLSKLMRHESPIIIHGFLKLLVISAKDDDVDGGEAQKFPEGKRIHRWETVHAVLTDSQLTWSRFDPSKECSTPAALEETKNGIVETSRGKDNVAIHLKDVSVGPMFVSSAFSDTRTLACFTLSRVAESSSPTCAASTSEDGVYAMPLVIRMSKATGTLWNSLLSSCSSATAACQASSVRKKKMTRLRKKAMRHRRRSSCAVNHAAAVAGYRSSTLRKFPSDRQSLHMSVKYNVEWECDGNDNRCAVCSVRFTLIRRRHHCRLCGNLVCDTCSQSRLPTAYSGTLERACDECVQLKTSALREDEDNGPTSSRVELSSSVSASKAYTARMRNKARATVASQDPDLMTLVQHYEAKLQSHRRTLMDMHAQFARMRFAATGKGRIATPKDRSQSMATRNSHVTTPISTKAPPAANAVLVAGTAV
eukprot:g2319.t1